MAKQRKPAAKKVAKKVVKKVLDKTELDEKIVAEYKENKSLYDTIACYVKCYGGYIVATGAGCVFGIDRLWGLGLFVAALYWGYKVNCNNAPCKGGDGTCRG